MSLISCDPGRGEWNTVMGPLKSPDPRGSLFVFDYTDDTAVQELVLYGFPAEVDFHPLGFDIFAGDRGTASLFVVNHRRTGPCIEVFDLTIDETKTHHSSQSLPSFARLQYRTTIGPHYLIKAANAIAALSHTSMYVTNDHAWTRLSDGTTWALIETITQPKLSWISHVTLSTLDSSSTITKAFQGLSFPNGIGLGHNKKTLYVTSSTVGAVYVFEIHSASPTASGENSLELVDQIDLGYPLDNLDVAQVLNETGDINDVILVGGHPSFLALRAVAADPHNNNPKIAAPSWISTLTRTGVDKSWKRPSKSRKGIDATGPHNHVYQPLNTKSAWESSTMYQNDGRAFRSSSGGALDPQKGVLLVSGLYENGVLFCRNVLP